MMSDTETTKEDSESSPQCTELCHEPLWKLSEHFGGLEDNVDTKMAVEEE